MTANIIITEDILPFAVMPIKYLIRCTTADRPLYKKELTAKADQKEEKRRSN